MATDPNNPLSAYGYDSQTGQQLAQSLGLTPQQLATAFSMTPATSVSQPQSGGQYGMASPGPTMGRDLDATVQQLRMMQATGGNQNMSLSGQAPSSIQGQVSNDPMNLAVNLGAAALNQPAVYNPTPGQIPAGSKGGVSTVQSPISSGTVPTVAQGPWNTNAGVFANQQQAQGMQAWQQQGASGSLADASAMEKAQGWAPGSIGKAFGADYGGPSNNPAPTAGGTPTPMMPANAAAARTAPATPFATAPAAPTAPTATAQPIPPAVHHDALQNAGMALYAHFGGDPATATQSQITDFHTQLTNAIGGIQNFTAGASTSPPTGAPGAPPAAPGPTRMMAGGGYVYPIGMQSGGFLPEDTSSDDPTEARHRALMAVSQAAQATQNTGSANQPSSVPSQAPAAPGGYTGPSAQQLAAQYGGTASSATPAGGWPGQTPSVAPSYDVPSDPDPDWQYTGQQSMAGPTGAGAGGASAAAGAAGVAGGLFSGLQSAMNTYAKSIGNFQMKPADFGPPKTQSGPPAQFTQEQADQKKQQQESPMLAAMYGYNPYQS